MQQMSGTLLDLILYLALVALGAFLGSRPQIQSLPMPWLGRFQTAALLLLIVTLGAELGANEEIVSSLASIGLNAFAITITSMVGSMLAVHALRKYILKLDALGRSAQEAAGEEEINIPLPEPEDLGEPCGGDDEKAKQIRTFLEGLLQHMDSAAQVTIYQPEKGRYKVILEGEKLGALIGRRGETLDAIQQLTNYSVNRGSDKRVRIHVDAENYRLKREQSLQHLARKVAAKVIKYKRNVTLEPMNAYERHVIHTALQDVENVTTYSMGTEPNRRVIVAYDRENKG